MTLEERLQDLEDKLAKALAELEGLRKENEGLRKENEGLRKENEKWKRGFNERKKRRTSRAEGQRKASSRRPGREPGHAGAHRKAPDRIDETLVHPPPTVCSCGGHVVLTGHAQNTIVQDIPQVQVQSVRHVAPEGACQRCGKRLRARLPGQPAQGASVAQVQLGPNLLALTLDLRFERHVPLAGISGFLDTWFGIEVTASGVYQMTRRWKDRTQGSYDQIVTFTREQAFIQADETPLRQDGLGGWAWLVRTDTSSLFRIELSRAGWVFDAMVGEHYAGRVGSDFYGVYRHRDGFLHAYCGAHVERKAKQIAEVSPSDTTERFRDELGAWYDRAKQAQKSGHKGERHGVKIALGKLIWNETYSQHEEVAKLQKRLRDHFAGVVAFVDHPEVPADNSACERDIRNLAGYRNVSGGTRSAEGSRVLAHWKSVTQTLKKNELEFRPWVVGAYQAYWQGLPLPSVFAEA